MDNEQKDSKYIKKHDYSGNKKTGYHNRSKQDNFSDLKKEKDNYHKKSSSVNQGSKTDNVNTRKPYKKKQHSGGKGYHHKGPKKFSMISVVIPLLNEEGSLPELALELENELKKVANNRYEVIFIDDGSTDDSFSILKQIHDRNPKFKTIRFRRNYGKSAALSVGFTEAKGDFVITMDADLQDEPKEIPNLISKLKEGYDLVSGWKKKRKDPFLKTISSKFYNFVTSVMTGVKLHDHNCGLKGYKKEVVKNLHVYGEMHRYLPALAHWDGFKITEIPVVHHKRRYGKSKYGLTRFIKGFLDLLTVLFTTRYIKRPLHFFGTVGTIFALTGFLTDAWLTVEWALGRTSLSNRPLALLGIALIIVGVQFISMGLIGELIAKNNLENENYKIRDRIY